VKSFLIERTYSRSGTIGSLSDAHGHLCYTIERPRTGDHPCIPEGTYTAKRYNSPKHGPNTWQLENVPGRENIQFHIANWPRELLGCIAPGMETGTDPETGAPGVTGSRAAYNRFMALTAGEDQIEFTLCEASR
jgi:hypothetical protein